MKKLWQVVANVVLYGFFLWLLVDSTVVEWDPWFAFVVAFVILVAIITSLIPSLRVTSTSPGTYPYRE
jgi:ABC-type lipoprotein release transport system permease subunit